MQKHSLIWSEIRELKEKYDIDYIWDISDDNLNNPEWFKSFVNQKPDDLSDIGFLVYSRVNRITDDIIPYLKRLNVYEVYLGIESGDNNILKKACKGASANTALKAAQRLKDAGIYYFPNFVLGLPEETEQSLNNTLKFSEELAKIGSIFRIFAGILMPMPGSPVYSMLMNDPVHGPEISKMDLVSIKELEHIWIENYTHIDYKTVEKYQKLINQAVTTESKTNSFGVKT
ncbi:MAG: radical SAM protein [Gammaproteobacteria bacterium]|nr:radical SAM protein [Gammaproteobacteria bacterium]